MRVGISASKSVSSGSLRLFFPKITTQNSRARRHVNRTTPSNRLKTPSNSSPQVTRIASSMIGNSRRRVFDCTVKGATRAVIPRIKPMLAILDPSALPIDRPGFPDQAAMPETSNSGADVPKPTTVKPMIIGETPRLRDIAAAPMTKRSAPQMRTIRPAMTARIDSVKTAIPFF